MAGTTVDFTSIIHSDQLACEIANRYREWDMLRNQWVESRKELRNYLYATSTLTTSNAILPWSNTTTIPKLTQIADNLHANYMATLFPQNKWMRWEALDKDSGYERKKGIIQDYMDNKLRQSGFISTASLLLQDWIQTGNCFATVSFERKYRNKEDGTEVLSYIGPKLIRISPYDIVFNPTAESFVKTPKIVKSILSIGEIAKLIKEDPTNEYMNQVFDKMVTARAAVRNGGNTWAKTDGYIADGFSSIQHYYESNYVEVLTFYGDIYDFESGQLMQDRVITVLDRAYILNNVENPSWAGIAPIFHSGWRERPDNLYAMGPLDNLVGMQYRIDHLENLKADIFDQIAYPILKIKGDVQEFVFEPGAKIYLGEESDVAYLVPDATALQADFQIRSLEDKMEEMAGAPRQAMGIRTPGEKTAFEVQQLQNSASRIFEHKAAHFERVFLEKILNAMLETARRNLDVAEEIVVKDQASGADVFISIQKEDIVGNGKIVPIGARHFAERARRIQNLQQLWTVKSSDPAVGAHLSGKEFARVLAEELGEPKLFGENIGVTEQAETALAANDQEATLQENLAISAEQGI